MTYVVMASIFMACIGRTYVVMASIFIVPGDGCPSSTRRSAVYIVMACIGMACIDMACVVMAYTGMVYT